MSIPPTRRVDEVLLADTIARAPAGALYVFGYGSLMWRPGFAHLGCAPARVQGYGRRCAVYSTHYRGTPAFPGLVLGLDAGGCCNGVLYRTAAARKAQTIRYLFRREMFAQVYVPKFVTVHRPRGAPVQALTFVVRRDGAQYAAPMPEEDAAAIIRRARGSGGSNRDYFLNTLRHLRALDMPSPMLERLCRLL